MPGMILERLLKGVDKLQVLGRLETEISGLAHDSRAVAPGFAFFALRGERTDGHLFLKDAVARGAAAVVSELKGPPPPMTLPVAWVQVKDALEALSQAAANFHGEPSKDLRVFGVTGTNGKTTTTYFLESILSLAGRHPGVLGTVNYRLDGTELAKASNTTPLSLELQALLAELKTRGATDVVMEVSSHALALRRVEEVLFDVAVFTNLHRDHLDFHKTREEYFLAKRRLFELLERSPKPARAAALNADDERFDALREGLKKARVVSYGISLRSDLRAENIELTPKGCAFTLRLGKQSLPVRLALVGRHNIYNALAACAAAVGAGMPLEAAVSGIEALRTVPGRLDPVDAGQDFTVLIDYAHTDSALQIVLENLQRLPHRKIITVFGCGGDRDRTKRGPMGVAACRGSALAVVTSDNPRREEPDRIIADVVEGLKAANLKNYVVEPDRGAAIRLAIKEAGPGDVVLIAGKGHEDYQILRDRTIHFDDREVAREALAERVKA